MQGGQLLHTLTGETQLKPRAYEASNGSGSSRDDILSDTISTFSKTMDYLSCESDDGNSGNAADVDQMIIGKLNPAPDRSMQSGFVPDDYLRADKGPSFERFSALSINGQKFTDFTIGGYGNDTRRTQKKIAEYVPLPAVDLPIIFNNKPLNFSHNFFQGLEMLLGRKYIKRLTNAQKYSSKDTDKLLPAIRKLIMAGAKDDDTNLTIFVKRVLSGTFSTVPRSSESDQEEFLIVEANLWGFDYIEGSMKLNDNELRMWLNVNYNAYRIAWFNSFKSSGLPHFALEGAQDRFEAKGDDALTREDLDRVSHESKAAIRELTKLSEQQNRQMEKMLKGKRREKSGSFRSLLRD